MNTVPGGHAMPGGHTVAGERTGSGGYTVTGEHAGPDGHAVVDTMDLDALADAVRACPAVVDLAAGPFNEAVTYLAGRRVPGIRVQDDGAIEVSVRGYWDVPAAALATQVRAALAGLAPHRRVDILLAEVADPPTASSQPREKLALAGSQPREKPAERDNNGEKQQRREGGEWT